MIGAGTGCQKYLVEATFFFLRRINDTSEVFFFYMIFPTKRKDKPSTTLATDCGTQSRLRFRSDSEFRLTVVAAEEGRRAAVLHSQEMGQTGTAVVAVACIVAEACTAAEVGRADLQTAVEVVHRKIPLKVTTTEKERGEKLVEGISNNIIEHDHTGGAILP
jgi:hypothetical protein